MTEEEKDQNKINDIDEEEVESLDDESNYESSSGDVESDVSNIEDSSSNSNYNPQNRYRQNREYHNRQYYKDQVNETNKERNLANEKAKETRANRDVNKNAYKSAKRDGTKDDIKNRKSDYKEAKKEDKLAQRERRQATRANRQAKFDRAGDTVNRVLHPVQTGKGFVRNRVNQLNPVDKIKEKAKQSAKSTAKKAGQAAKQGVKKAGKAVAKGAQAAGKTIISGIAKLIAMVPPPVWIGIAAVLVLLIAAMIIVVVVIGDEDEEMINTSTIGCVYENLNGIGEETTVKIMDCDGQEEMATVSLEKYIAGVAINDLGALYDSEVSKAYLILTRSKILYSALNDLGNYTYDKGSDSIIVNQCEDAPFYWDYTTDLYQSDTEPIKYSTTEVEGFTLIKQALSNDARVLFENSADQVACMYLTDKDNKLVSVDIDVDTLIDKATANARTDNGSYTGLLIGNTEAANISTGQVNYASYFSSDVGDYAKWKQCDKAWGSIPLGKQNVCHLGCFLVSMSMLVAHSEVDTGNILDFNPGTFINAMNNVGAIGSGGGTNQNYISKVIPNFEFVSSTKVKNDYSILKQLADSGCFIALEVKKHCSGQHWVAIDNAASSAVNWQQIYIWDPSSSKDPTLDHVYKTKSGKSCKYNANTAACFKRVK